MHHKRRRPRSPTSWDVIHQDVLRLIQKYQPTSQQSNNICQRQLLIAAYDAAWKAFQSTASNYLDKLDALQALARRKDNLCVNHVILDAAARTVCFRLLYPCTESTRQKQHLIALRWLWLGHVQTLWRLEDALIAVWWEINEEPGTSWMRNGIELLVKRSEEIAEEIVSYIIRIAFTVSSSASARTYLHEILLQLCTSSSLNLCLRLVVSRIQELTKRPTTTDQDEQLSRLRLFLHQVLKRFCASETITVQSSTSSVLSHFQDGLPAATIAQLFRQVLAESYEVEDHPSTVRRVYYLISICSKRDPVLSSHLLGIAHDLAFSALDKLESVLFQQSIDLVAAVTITCNDDASQIDSENQNDSYTYLQWFVEHFALHVHPSTSNHICLRRATSTMPCALMQSKRQLQFVCAFLLEWNRTDSPRALQPHPQQLYAHMNAIATHQHAGNTYLSTLLSDFCSQTRQLYNHTTCPSQEKRGISESLSNSSSQYAANTQSLALDLLKYTSSTTKLITHVQQWKLLQPQQWQQQILPCCLDLQYWCVNGVSGRPQVQQWMSLVHTLFQNHLVTISEYQRYLEQVEAYMTTTLTEQNLGKRMQSHFKHLEQVTLTLQEALEEYQGTVDVVAHLYWEKKIVPNFQVWIDALIALNKNRKLQYDTMITIWPLILQGGMCDKTRKNKQMIQDFMDRQLMIWMCVLSETIPDATMEMMNTFCTAIIDYKSPFDPEKSEYLLELTACGCVLGLLASVPRCTSMSLKWVGCIVNNVFHTTSPTMSEVWKMCAFLCGFLYGRTKHSTSEIDVQNQLPSKAMDMILWRCTRTLCDERCCEVGYEIWQTMALMMTGMNHQLVIPAQWSKAQCQRVYMLDLNAWSVIISERYKTCSGMLGLVTMVYEKVDDIHAHQRQYPVYTDYDLCVWIVEIIFSQRATTPDHTIAIHVLLLLLERVWHLCSERDDDDIKMRNGAMVVEKLLTVLLVTMKSVADTKQTKSSEYAHILSIGLDCVKMMNGVVSTVNLSTMQLLLQYAGMACAGYELADDSDNEVDRLLIVKTLSSHSLRVLLNFVTTTHVDGGTLEAVDIPISILVRWVFMSAELIESLSTHGSTWKQTLRTLHAFYQRLGLSETCIHQSTTMIQQGVFDLCIHSLAPSIQIKNWLICSTPAEFQSYAARIVKALMEKHVPPFDPLLVDIGNICMAKWKGLVSDPEQGRGFSCHALLIHILVYIATQSPLLSRSILRCGSSLAESVDINHKFGIFWILSVAHESLQLQTMLQQNPSLWVNQASLILCQIMTVQVYDKSVCFMHSLLPLPALQKRLSTIIYSVLSFAASSQVDILNKDLVNQLQTYFPEHHQLVEQVPVLCVNDLYDEV